MCIIQTAGAGIFSDKGQMCHHMLLSMKRCGSAEASGDPGQKETQFVILLR